MVVLWAPRWGVVGETPPWAWLFFVVGIDVAHVWSTLFRVYLDRDELRRRPMLYSAAPIVAYALGVMMHQLSADLFWRLLAYVAVWHFVRQQVGWMTLYGRRAKSSLGVLRLDALAMYAATLGPVVWWHANLPRSFWWFRDGDFVVVNERQRADNGEMVIAMLHGNSATVKKFYREKDGRIRLQPANETMPPMYVHENDITIQGIVVGVMRRY